MYWKRLIAALLLSLAIRPVIAQASDNTPESVVRSYCKLDFNGARTRSDTFAPVNRLILWHTEPGWDQAFVVRQFRIVSAKTNGTTSVVTVEYDLVGHIDGGELKETRRNQRVTFTLKQGNREWMWRNEEPVLVQGKVAWRITKPIIPPHISVPYAIKHFESIINDSQGEYNQQLIRTVKRLKQAQRTLSR